MSLIVCREGVALENQMEHFAHEFHSMMQPVLDASTTQPGTPSFDIHNPWRGQDIALTPIVYEELSDTFPEEEFCMMRGQRHISEQGRPLEEARSWVSWVRPNIAASYVIDLASEPCVIAPYAELWDLGVAYSGFAGFKSITDYQDHLSVYDPTAPTRIGHMRDLFERAILAPSVILEAKEVS